MASFSFKPSFCNMPSSLSESKMRMRSSSSDRKNLEWPGSPWRPERPRNWLSMRRLSCRSVASTNRPPAASAFSFSRATCLPISSGRRALLRRSPAGGPQHVGELFRLLDRGGADQHRLAAQLAVLDQANNRAVLLLGRAIDLVVVVDADQRHVGRPFHPFEIVDEIG